MIFLLSYAICWFITFIVIMVHERSSERPEFVACRDDVYSDVAITFYMKFALIWPVLLIMFVTEQLKRMFKVFVVLLVEAVIACKGIGKE